MTRHAFLLALFSGLIVSGQASAHSFGQSYTLPVPIWLYLYGASAALLVSFIVAAYFIKAPTTEADTREIEVTGTKLGACLTNPQLLMSLRAASVCLLVLAILAGFVGVNHPYRNINMTLFWVIFCLGYTYLTALLGDWFAVLNPFRVIVDCLEKRLPPLFSGVWNYPGSLGYWPAVVFYIGFIWLELFGRSTPFALSVSLTAYLLITMLGCVLVGKRAWFQYGEFLGVFLRLIGKIAPVRVAPEGGKVRLFLRRPCAGLVQEKRVPLSLLVFVLFMLSSTAFDGLHETSLWVGAFWENLYRGLLIPLYGQSPAVSYPVIKQFFLAYQTAALLLSPLIYLAIFTCFMALAKRLVRSALSVRDLMGWFCLSLIPIVFAYHFTHYFTLLQAQGPQLVRLISDPLGLGWNLFGTATTVVKVIPDMGFVWHTQVFVIVAGHILSVYLAHIQALKLFGDRRSAVLSQLPVLVLMLGFTTVGLWILSLPHAPSVPG